MAQITGTCRVLVNGRTIRAAPGASIELGGKERTVEYADHGVAGYSEKPIAAKISATIKHGADTDLDAIRNSRDVTLIFETDTGRNYTIRNAFCTMPPTLTAGAGEAPVEFAGLAAIEE